MATGDVISTLNELIETCRDGEAGFRTAAEAVEDPDVKHLFGSYSQQRAEFAAELEREVTRLGETPEAGGSVAGALHHGWMSLRSVLTGRDARAVIAAAETGEDSAVRAYEEALRTDLPPDVRMLVEGQSSRIKEAHDRVRQLRDRRRVA